MENPDDKYLWKTDKEEYFPQLSVSELVLGFFRFLIFLSFTLCIIPLFVLAKLFFKITGVKWPMIIIRRYWSILSLRLCSLKLKVEGSFPSEVCLVVSNHISWLDILTIQSVADVVFVAKSDVKNWPGLGFLAKLANTLFVERSPQKIGFHSKEANIILAEGNSICFFPEGTSSDGLRVLKFRSGFFQLAFRNMVEEKLPILNIQPVTIFYEPVKSDVSSDFYGWWGNMSLIGHIIKVLCKSSGFITLKFHDLLKSDSFQDRKHLASKAEDIIRDEVLNNMKKKHGINNE